MSEFDRWWEENYMNVSADRTEAEDIYNLGVESQQAKINDSENTRAVLYRENMDLREKNIDLQAKIDLLEVQLKGAEERAKLILDHKNKMVDELQSRVDDHDLKLELFISELEKTYREDKDNKIDYWRGFSECADSSIKVFYRDVGFINLKGNKNEN